MPDSRIIVGDCREVLATLDEQPTLIFCDPPYNIGVDYGEGYSDRMALSDYGLFTNMWMYRCAHALSSCGSLWVLINEHSADHVGHALSDYGHRRSRIIWRETFGQYRDTGFASGHRHLFYHVIDKEHYTWNPDPIREPSARMLMGDKRAKGPRVPDDVWDVSRVQGNCKERIPGHPCQLKQWPLERIILCSSNPGDLVCDPMCGSGTFGAAAMATGRRFLGIEQNPEYAKMAEDRIAKAATGSVSLFGADPDVHWEPLGRR